MLTSTDSTSPATDNTSNTQPPQSPPKDPNANQLPKAAANDNDSIDDETDDETHVAPTINDVESLRKGHLKTKQNIPQLDYTILVVGETGVGKSSVLEFIANIITGNPISKYDFNIIDQENEAGGSGKHSQTNSAKTYIFESANGHTVRILDTPGLADTRGIEQDEKHKRSIANEIADNITTVTGVIILANGTVPRITVGTDYGLSTLSAIFPRSLADNIAFMFTNISNPLSWNFAQDSIPEVLKGAPQFRLDNPLALHKKFLEELKDKSKTTSQLRKEMRAAVNSGEAKALEMLVHLFDWLDGCVHQPTKDILSLYDQSQRIEMRITNIVTSMNQLADKRNEVQKIASEMEKAKSNMSIFEDFETIANREEWVQKDTENYNTLCFVPRCYSNCHMNCRLNFTLDPRRLKGCAMMRSSLGRNKCASEGCGHDRTKHKRSRIMWEKEKRQEKIVDEEMKAKFNNAKSEKEEKEQLKVMAEQVLKTMSDKIDSNTAELGRLVEEYSNLSLSGSFSGQVEKALVMLEQNYKTLKEKHVDEATLNKVEGSLDTMKQKLEVLKEAKDKKAIEKKALERKANIIAQVKTLARATNSQTVTRRKTSSLNEEHGAVPDPSHGKFLNAHSFASWHCNSPSRNCNLIDE